MKNLLLALLILSSCQKEENDPVTSGERKEIGTWRIVPTGNPADTFRYYFTCSPDSLYGVYKAGRVQDGAIEIKMFEGCFYTVGYRDHIGDSIFSVEVDTANHPLDTMVLWHRFVHHDARYTPVNFTDSIPATLF